MKNINEILQENKVELTGEQSKAIEKAIVENYKTVSDYEKQAEKLTKLEEKNTAQQTAFDDFKKNYDGVDVEGLKTQVSTLETSLNEANGKYDKHIKQSQFGDVAKTVASELGCIDIDLAMKMLDIDNLMESKDQSKDVKTAFEKLKEEKTILFKDVVDEPTGRTNINLPIGGATLTGDAGMRSAMGLPTKEDTK